MAPIDPLLPSRADAPVADPPPRSGSSGSIAAPPGAAEAAPPAPGLDPQHETDAPPPRGPGRRDRRRARREAKWERPRPPRDWRFWVGGLGRVLIVLGLLMFGFVAYQLWGTAIETARAQRALETEFEEALAEVEPVSAPASGSASADAGDSAAAQPDEATDELGDPAVGSVSEDTGRPAAVPVEQQNLPFVQEGDALARIEIPRIGVNDIVVAGVGTNDLKKGPGHYPDTPVPGQLGNAAIAGHRTTYGQPFHDVDDLEPGDEIIVTTLSGRFVYRVTGQAIVEPGDYEVVATTDATVANLTLTSCHPKWTAQDRIVIFSELDAPASAQVGEPVLNYGRPTTEDAEAAVEADEPLATIDDPVVDSPEASTSGDAQPASDSDADEGADEGVGPGTTGTGSAVAAANAEIATAFAEGWFSDPGALVDVLLWAVLLATIATFGFLVARSLRRTWVGVLAAALPFVVALYFFYQNVNRLLPPNL